MEDIRGSGQSWPLFGGVRFLEVWLKSSIFKCFTFFFTLQTYSEEKGEETGYV